MSYLLEKANINDFLQVSRSQNFTATTILATSKNGNPITVSNILGAISYYIDYITANYDVNMEKYSQAILFLKSLNLLFTNQSSKGVSKDCIHYAVDVLHEIADRHTTTSTQVKDNAKTAIALNVLIDLIE